MSFVEKALKKIQDAKVAETSTSLKAIKAPAHAETIVGRLVESPSSQSGDAIGSRPVAKKAIHVDRSLLRSAGLLPPDHQERELAAQYRQIKRPLIAAARGKGESAVSNGHLIMIASAFPGEGKTFTSVNLAMSLALEKDFTVLLLDADVAKAHVSRLFGVEGERGLLDALRDPAIDIETLVLPTDIPGLSVLPAGTNAEHATELLASERMQQIVSSLGSSDSNRMVLFDSPPLLLTSESRVLAQIVGQVALVVCANRTPQKAVLEAISYIGPNKPVGLVLNQATQKSQNGYYYGYGSYGDPERTQSVE